MEKKHQNRQFDWGPPVQTGDSLKEWLVYIFIIVILAIGTWFLMDINRQKQAKINKAASKIVAVDEKLDAVVSENLSERTMAPLQQTTEVTIKYGPESIKKKGSVSASSKDGKNYYVQIGAFGDEPSAKEIYDLLKKEGIDAKLLQPDEQFEIYRLVVGPFATEELAESKAEKLNAIDFPCFVVEIE